MQEQAPRLSPNFARLLAEGAGPDAIGAASIRAWLAIEESLSPIIGLRGVAALYKRSLYLIRGEFPWLATVSEGALAPSEFAALGAVLAQQSGAEAAAASTALLKTFHHLLTSLIGAALSERLLPSDLDLPPSGSAAQDPSP